MTTDELYRRAGISRPTIGSVFRPLDPSGHNVFASASGFGTNQADNQRLNEFAPLAAALNPVRPIGYVSPVAPVAPVAPSNTFASTAAGRRATGPNAEGNPFETVSNVKNPAIENILSSILGNIRGLSSDPNQNTLNVKTNVKSPDVESRVGSAFGNYDVDVNNHNQSIADFTKEFLDAHPAATATAQNEANAINQWFNGGVLGNLNTIAGDRETAVRAAVNRALGQAQRNANMGRLIGGDSSYVDQQFMDTVGQIMADEARQKADLARQNYLTVAQTQPGLAGLQQRLIDQAIQRRLVPTQAGQQIAANDVARLGSLANIQNTNRFYTLDSPEQLLARKLDLLGAASTNDIRNTFYGLRGPREEDTSGLLPIYHSNGRSPVVFPDFSPLGTGANTFMDQPTIPSRRPVRGVDFDRFNASDFNAWQRARPGATPGMPDNPWDYDWQQQGNAAPLPNILPGMDYGGAGWQAPPNNVFAREVSSISPEQYALAQRYRNESGQWPYTESPESYSPELWNWLQNN